MSNTFLYAVRSKGTVNFLEALATGAASAVNAIPGIPPAGNRHFRIKAVRVLAVENIGPALYFFDSAAAPTVDVDTDGWISQFTFTAGMGQRIGGAGLYRYYVDGLNIPYYMAGSGISPARPTLNVALMNVGATAKSADAAGAVQATFWLEPDQTW